MKKFINQVELVEDQMIAGMVKAYPQYVRKLDCGNVVVRTEKKEGKVALISGGGSGHEPAHGGYVGTGMLDAQDLLTILDAFVAGVQLRGKSVAGEKTMLDAMIPARDAVKAALDAGKSAKEALSVGVAAAEQGVEYTKTIIATKGRASYLGERSLGHQDPGATSFTTMLRVVAEHV